MDIKFNSTGAAPKPYPCLIKNTVTGKVGITADGITITVLKDGHYGNVVGSVIKHKGDALTGKWVVCAPEEVLTLTNGVLSDNVPQPVQPPEHPAVKQLRNLKGGENFHVKVRSKQHCKEVLQHFTDAGYILDTDKYHRTWQPDTVAILCYKSNAYDHGYNVGVFNHFNYKEVVLDA